MHEMRDWRIGAPRFLRPGAVVGVVLGGLMLVVGASVCRAVFPERPTLFVAPDGDDTAAGTAEHPVATLEHAVELARPGAWIEVCAGTYHRTHRLRLRAKGTADAPLRLWAREGDHVVLDCSGLPHDDHARGIEISGTYWHVRGIEVVDAWDNGVNVSGQYNTVERCVVHGCGDSGIQLSQPAGNTLVLNCDSYRNYDARTHGENADGFAAKLALGPGNVFRGCRAWENADDGYDLWRAPEPILIEDCYAWRNGNNYWGDPAFAGNGNGFKLGGDRVPGAHRVVRCVAWGQKNAGFTQNNNPGPLTLVNNTSFDNGSSFVIYMSPPPGTGTHTLLNNLAIGGELRLRTPLDARGNSWQLADTSGEVGRGDLGSTKTDTLEGPRGPDGSLPTGPDLSPEPGGRLVDAGVACDVKFAGSAPDIGAIELARAETAPTP